ncbi:3-hydroxybutyrate dehydrogenase [Thermodesulforhabdus norvegica]|uniref:3-hydroxybutyrate dehydrogenase n=1 Tax=Thermodesulforhabdus norvegica TaxID=39841 RepID=A0A1I4SBP8_9BACT|nr:3-hydroxybutyrate dehydrogenase [Thermodesulforhabdus norvegica]SFM61899.1 3-hydroxybutyrate dehydrogenase [Thermodesulforhabdus norvegica]
MQGKRVLVTGAGSGIGEAVARAFAEKGAKVIVNDLRSDASSVADEIGGEFIKADLSVTGEVISLARQALAGGPVHILINNAGFQHIDPVEDFPIETWQKMLQVMLTAPFILIRELVPAMKRLRWGRIINIASIHGLVASPFKSAYISAKHGLIGLTKTVALEVAEFGITVNAICPAYVRTPLVENQIADQSRTLGIPEKEVIEKVMLAQAAIKRLIEPDEIASYALFLASEAASAITGSTQVIDLGWTAR